MAHINNKHKERSSAEQIQLMDVHGMECFQCSECHKSYCTAAKLRSHITRATNECTGASLPEGSDITNMVQESCLSNGEYDACCRALLAPLMGLHRTWTRLMAQILHELLGDMLSPNDVNRNVKGAQALMLFAGTVEYTRGTKEIITTAIDEEQITPPVMRVIDLLRKITSKRGQAASIILWVAKAAKPPPEPPVADQSRRRGGSDREPPTARDKAAALAMTAQVNISAGKFTIAGKQLAQAEGFLVEDERGMSGVPEYNHMAHEEMISKIKALHPERSDRDNLPELTNNPSHILKVSRRTVEDVCKGVHTNSCEGPDAWSANVIKQIFAAADDLQQGAAEGDDLIGRLQKVINRITAGLMPHEVRYCLVRLKSILIPKVDTGGFRIGDRPIGIMGHITRMMHKAVAQEAGIQAQEYLYPMQVAVNTKGGCDIVTAVAQEAYERGNAVTTNDVQTAFPTMPRGNIYKGIQEGCPPLTNFFLWQYTDSSPLFDSQGNKFGECQTGVPQGDPASMLLFGLGYQTVLHELRDLLKNTVDQHNADHPYDHPIDDATIVSYADDSIYVTDPSIAFQLVDPVTELYASHGLVVHKFYIIGKNVEELQDRPVGVTLRNDGGLICKSGIGSTPFCNDRLREKVGSVCIPVRSLMLIPARHATAQVKYSTNQQLVFHSTICNSNIPMEVRQSVLKAFDDRIDQVIGAINGYTANERNSMARSLPVKAGGLGILKTSGIQHETSKIQSGLRVLEWAGTRPEADHLANLTRQQLGIIRLGECNQVASDLDITALVSTDYKAACATLKKHRDKIYEDLADRHAHDLGTSRGGGAYAALFRCNRGGPGTKTRSFLKFATSYYSERDFPNAAFSSLFRFHVGMPPLGDGADELYCKCGSKLPMSHDPSHPLHCRLMNFQFSQRHTSIVKAFQSFFRDVKTGASIELEPSVGDVGQHRADLKVMDGVQSMTMDVVVTDTCHPDNVHRLHTHFDPDNATRRVVDNKNTKYSRILGLNSTVRTSFFPIGICASGRVGLEGRVLAEISGARHRGAKRRLYESIAIACSHEGGRMMVAGLSNLTENRPFQGVTGDPPLPPPPADADDVGCADTEAYTNHLRRLVRGSTAGSSGGSQSQRRSSSSRHGRSRSRDNSEHRRNSASALESSDSGSREERDRNRQARPNGIMDVEGEPRENSNNVGSSVRGNTSGSGNRGNDSGLSDDYIDQWDNYCRDDEEPGDGACSEGGFGRWARRVSFAKKQERGSDRSIDSRDSGGGNGGKDANRLGSLVNKFGGARRGTFADGGINSHSSSLPSPPPTPPLTPMASTPSSPSSSSSSSSPSSSSSSASSSPSKPDDHSPNLHTLVTRNDSPDDDTSNTHEHGTFHSVNQTDHPNPSTSNIGSNANGNSSSGSGTSSSFGKSTMGPSGSRSNKASVAGRSSSSRMQIQDTSASKDSGTSSSNRRSSRLAKTNSRIPTPLSGSSVSSDPKTTALASRSSETQSTERQRSNSLR